MQRAYEITYGRRALFYRQQGPVPALGTGQEELGILW